MRFNHRTLLVTDLERSKAFCPTLGLRHSGSTCAQADSPGPYVIIAHAITQVLPFRPARGR